MLLAECWEAFLRAFSCCLDDREVDHVPSQSLLNGHAESSVQQSVLGAHQLEPALQTASESQAPASGGTPPWTPPSAVSQPIAQKADPLSDTLPTSSTVESLESYNAMVGSLASQGDIPRSGSVELNVETCAVCCSEIILGPQSALKNLKIPPGEFEDLSLDISI